MAPSPSKLRSLARHLVQRAAARSRAATVLGALTVAIASLGSAGCDEAPATTKKGPNAANDPGEQHKFDEGRKLIDGAVRAISEKKFEKAREMLRKAAELNNESQRFEIEETVEKLDKREAKLWTNEVAEPLKDKDCAAVFKQLATPIKNLESEAFTREIRRLIGTEALACLQGAIDEKVLAASYADARKLAGDPDAKTVLGPTAIKKVSAELEVTLTDALKGQITDDLKARRWQAAVDKLDAAQKKGDATEEQVAALIELVRAGVAPEIAAAAVKSLGSKDAAATLKQIDAQIKLCRWEVMAPDAAELQKDKALPAELVKKREALATWVEAMHVAMKVIKTPEKRWAHGKVAVYPPTKVDGESKRDIVHGAQIWIVGATKDRALITDVEPGPGGLSAVLDKVIGWVAMDRLAKEPTADWLVPDDQLKNERVWGPLRKDEPTYELGVVMDVAGKDITVKRLTDDAIVKMTRKQLRSGRLAPGTKVITFCTAKDMPAQVLEVVGGRAVKLKCDGGQEKEDVLASLRSKAELLPPSK